MVLVITFIEPRKDKPPPGEEKSNLQTCNKMFPLRLTSLRWIKSLLYYENGQEEYSKNLYQVAVISVLAVGYSMLVKKILCMSLPSVQCFNLEDTGKLVAVVTASEMTREYLIKQKILPDHINV